MTKFYNVPISKGFSLKPNCLYLQALRFHYRQSTFLEANLSYIKQNNHTF